MIGEYNLAKNCHGLVVAWNSSGNVPKKMVGIRAAVNIRFILAFMMRKKKRRKKVLFWVEVENFSHDAGENGCDDYG